jgi:DNA-binding CsgD family transcriptional regulator
MIAGTRPEWSAGLLDPDRGSPQPRGSAELTPRERDVAALVARGLTSRRIADELVITEGTAALHVKRILGKLGFSSRVQIAAWSPEGARSVAPGGDLGRRAVIPMHVMYASMHAHDDKPRLPAAR